ncbi:MAG: hypothetical protein AAGB51_03005 [Planctomycetota bacterium]
MGTRLSIVPPEDYRLGRDVCSYGYFVLWPNHWDVDRRALTRSLELPEGPAAVGITQPSEIPGGKLTARFDRALARPEQAEAKRQIARMLRLSESADDIAAFHRVDKRFKKTGHGRLFRSPTLFEDVIKTVTSCNVAWPSTVNMNQRLCEVVGRKTGLDGFPTFPTPAKMARTRVGTLRARCRVGYRDQRMVELGKLFAPRGKKPPELDPEWFEDPANDDEVVFKRLIDLPGIGPYAAGNIMQLLGRYSRLAIDTETIRHAKNVLGYAGTERELHKKIEAHYEPFGAHKFRSYWFELWEFYEQKAGPAETWRRDSVARAFTASQLK